MLKPMILTISILFSSCILAANMEDKMKHNNHNHADNKSDVAKSLSTQAYERDMDKMHHEMMIDYTGDADIDFAKGMIPHHKGAIDMAETLLEYGKDPVLIKMAGEIIAAQKSEIKILEEWLKDNVK